MKIVYREDQKEIMEYRSGTMGIQAVPGAGKTFIITNLAAKLLENMVKNEEGGKILVLTYMNSAVNNFRSRIKQIVEDKNIPKSKFEVMTIHSLAMSIIKENTEIAFINEEFEIIDDYKKEILLNNAIDRYRAEMKEKRPSAKDPVMSFLDGKNIKKDTDSKWEREFRQIVSSAIKLLKYAELDSDTLEKLVEKRNEKYKIEKDIVKRQDYRGIMSVISPIYSYYQEEMRNNSYLDYDDILLMAYNILVENEDIAEAYQKKYRYVFEDECQDSNLIQGKIIELIAANKNNRKKSNKNLVRVGDVNQSITGTFAGADPQHFINFCKNADYSYKMDMASRSSKDIIDLANELVSMVNKDKRDAYYNSLEKLYIREVKKGAGYKENPNIDNYEVFYKKAYSDAENINSIVDEIKAIKKEHKEYSIGVLSFANYKIEELAETLELNNIEFDHLGSSTNERKKIINDLKAGVDFLIEPSNEENLKKFIIEAFIIRRSSQVNSTENKHEKIVKARQRLFAEEVDAFEEIEYSKIEEVDGSEIAEIENYFKNVDVEKWIYNDEYYRNFAEEPSEEDSLDAVIKKKLSKIDIIKHKFNMDKIREKLRRISMASQINPADTIKAIADEIDTSHEERMLISYILFYIENLVNFENADLERVSIALDKKYSRIFDAAIDTIYDLGEKEPEASSVTLATLHKSKGMEWDAVIIFGLNTNNFPSSYKDYFRSEIKYLKDGYKYPEADINRDIDYFKNNKLMKKEAYEMKVKKDIIDERVRLLYVGITRAKKRLFLLHGMNETNKVTGYVYKKKASVFFTELAKFIDEKSSLRKIEK